MLKLTKREKAISYLILCGHTNKEISNIIKRSVHTINAHVRNIYKKNSLSGRVELCRKLLIEGVYNERKK